MEGPYRDLGGGFVRLTGLEGSRRGPSRITSVEAALLELLRNARDAGARNIFVASMLHRRRFRTLTVIDDGCGVPAEYAETIFEPGVTTRHLNPTLDSDNPSSSLHGAGISLYHLRNAAHEAKVVSASSPTAVRATFDTHSLPERSLQSASRPSKSNLEATLRNFARRGDRSPPNLYHDSPARILATMIYNHIIQTRDRASGEIRDLALRVGLEVSLRTVQRVLHGGVSAVEPMKAVVETRNRRKKPMRWEGPEIHLEKTEESKIKSILDGVARARYLEAGDLRVEARHGELHLKVAFYEPEEEYEH